MLTVDGFPVQDSMSFLADEYPDINQWSYGTVIKITVADFYMNPRWVTWKGAKMWVADYGFFVMLLKDWIKGDKKNGRDPMTKEEALDLMVEMS